VSGNCILVVDDDPGIVQTMTWVLKEHGYDVCTADGAPSAYEILEHRTPDLMLLDVVMNGIDGFEFLAQLKRDVRYRDVPVLMVSSASPEEATITTLGLGAADFIRKPFRVRELLARIQAQLRARAEMTLVRDELRALEEQLARAREEAESRRKLVDILHEVTGDLTTDEIYHILARRIARTLNLTYCSVVLARPGDRTGIVTTAYENPGLRNLVVQLEKYPEIRAALDHGRPVLVSDVSVSPYYAQLRKVWETEGTTVETRSLIALPFSVSRTQTGVFFLRRAAPEPPLTAEDVGFADAVVRAALASIQRAQALESSKADNARLEALAHTDALTQVLNRRALSLRLAAEIDRAKRYDSVVTLLMIDIDHFKRVNDTHGHLVGDDVLRTIASVLRHEVRSADVVARYGGEEFVVVLPETDHAGAIVFAERIRERIERETFGEENGVHLRLTTSIGVAAFPASGVDRAEELLARADAALYRAKAEGRNRVHG
jgi:two-component system, cell cycle response regulator